MDATSTIHYTNDVIRTRVLPEVPPTPRIEMSEWLNQR